MQYQNFLTDLFRPLPQIDQTDRIQGMARYMNEGGASSEWLSILIFLGVMFAVIILLKIIAAIKKGMDEKRRLEARRKKAAEQRAAQKAAPPTFHSLRKRH